MLGFSAILCCRYQNKRKSDVFPLTFFVELLGIRHSKSSITGQAIMYGNISQMSVRGGQRAKIGEKKGKGKKNNYSCKTETVSCIRTAANHDTFYWCDWETFNQALCSLYLVLSYRNGDRQRSLAGRKWQSQLAHKPGESCVIAICCRSKSTSLATKTCHFIL